MSDDDERKPDHSDPGQGTDVGKGYPEEQPGGASPAGDSPASGESDDAPGAKPSSPDEGDAGQATGNPGAAG